MTAPVTNKPPITPPKATPPPVKKDAPKPSLIQRIYNYVTSLFKKFFGTIGRILGYKSHKVVSPSKYATYVPKKPCYQMNQSTHRTFAEVLASDDPKKPPPYLILSIDGGGMRGAIPAKLLELLEKDVGEHTSKMFDFIAGTSTGGILTAALSIPDPKNQTEARWPASKVVELYDKHGPEIFHTSWEHAITSIGGVIGPKYSRKGLCKVLTNLLGDDTIESSLTDVMVTSFDMKNREVFVFQKENFKNITLNSGKIWVSSSKKTDKWSDAIEATTAAPTYFPSKYLEGRNLVDGGLAGTNPAPLAARQALVREDLKGREIFMISLGTGDYPSKPITSAESRDWGIAQWVGPLIYNSFEVLSMKTELELERLARNNERFHYTRFNVLLQTPEQAAMDNTDSKVMKQRIAIAEAAYPQLKADILEPLKQHVAAKKAANSSLTT